MIPSAEFFTDNMMTIIDSGATLAVDAVLVVMPVREAPRLEPAPAV